MNWVLELIELGGRFAGTGNGGAYTALPNEADGRTGEAVVVVVVVVVVLFGIDEVRVWAVVPECIEMTLVTKFTGLGVVDCDNVKMSYWVLFVTNDPLGLWFGEE